MTSPPNWFIAFPFPSSSLPSGTMASLPSGTRAFEPDDLHITVAFLGPVGENRALAAWERLAATAGSPCRTHLGPRAAFGSPRRPSALGLDLDGAPEDGALTQFLDEWRDRLRADAGLAAENRPVRPHVTLGRPPRRPDTHWPGRLAAWLGGGDDHGDPVVLDRVALYTRADRDARRRFRQVRQLRWTPQGPLEESE